MSEWRVETVRIGPVQKHPDADLLSITTVHDGYPCIVKTGDFQEGDLATYIPVDSVVPDAPMFAFLKNRRIKPLKLRGIFSMGLLVPHVEGTNEGDDVTQALGITRYEPAMKVCLSGEAESAPGHFPFSRYTDVDSLRRFKRGLAEGEDVVIVEKIHGTNARYAHDGERLWLGSHGMVRKPNNTNVWGIVANQLNLEERLAKYPLRIFYGEIYGKGVQDLWYDAPQGLEFRVFDVFDVALGRHLDHDDMVKVVEELELKTAPVLYRGPWNVSLIKEHCEGRSTLNPQHVREGFVVRPVKERLNDRFERVVYKMVGEGYLMRKNSEDNR